MNFSIVRLLLAAALFSLVTACAVRQSPAQLAPLTLAAAPALERLEQQADIELDTGYFRTLKSGSVWKHVGSVNEGEVYRPVRDVFTLEGSQMHEAYLVVAGNTLTGFYLPVEHSFSPLKHKISLTFSKQEQ